MDHRPDLLERVPEEQLAVLHDPADRVGVADVLERILVEHHEVRELARFHRADVALEADRLGAMDRRGAQRLHRGQAAGLKVPDLPVAAEPLHLAMPAETDAPSGVDDRGCSGDDAGVAVLLRHEPLPAPLDVKLAF